MMLTPEEMRIVSTLHPVLQRHYLDRFGAPPSPAPPTTPVVHHTSGFVVALPIARPNVCEFLENRAEFKHGCGGWRCLHGCEKGLPAVPGTYCQTCSQYVDSGEKFQ